MTTLILGKICLKFMTNSQNIVNERESRYTNKSIFLVLRVHGIEIYKKQAKILHVPNYFSEPLINHRQQLSLL